MLCNGCESTFSTTHRGRAEVNSHLGSKKHKAAVQAAVSSSRVTSFFNETGSNVELALVTRGNFC